ncbi:hypothetical protein RRG08_061699 [Elysia crispata]|uniref:Uncharacterized protein n=1 Tax=Elysia crispata TaxID=231223 RepID=A0AAE1DSD4_9GAST|nr:hypothetical protein RRG08_061699 [Elysia crispata]
MSYCPRCAGITSLHVSNSSSDHLLLLYNRCPRSHLYPGPSTDHIQQWKQPEAEMFCCVDFSGSQQLSRLFNSKPQADADITETAKFGKEIYGFPEPRRLSLERTNDDTTLTYFPRHSVKYTAGVAPFGVVNVTIFDLVEADYTNYTLTVDNGVGNALVYTFYLNEGLLKYTSLL